MPLPLVPGIVSGLDGSIRIAGFGEDHSALLVNSVDVTDPATGAFGLSVPIDSVETIEVSEMPYLAEYGLGASQPVWSHYWPIRATLEARSGPTA